MKILDKYIRIEIIKITGIVLLTLLSIDIFFYLINELRYVGKGNYNLLTAIYFIFLTIPRKIYILFPWAALLGCLLSLSNLHRSYELVVMQLAGVSYLRISWAAIKTGLILAIIVIILGEIIVPITEKLAQKKKITALSNGQMVQTKHGTWLRYQNQFIHMDKIVADGNLQNVTFYQLDEDLHLEQVTFAETVNITESGWQLYNLRQTKFLKDKVVNYTKLTEELRPYFINLDILRAANNKHLERLSILELNNLIKIRAYNRLHTGEYKLAFWSKVFHPLSIIVMVWLAMPFTFSSLRSGIGLKIIIGILLGFSFYVLNLIFGPASIILDMPAVIATSLPSLIFFLVGLLASKMFTTKLVA